MSSPRKFRIWDIEAKKMRHIITDLHWALHGLVSCTWMDSATTELHTLVNDADCVGGKDRFILMQYIGRDDANGREVCERDIAKFPEHDYLAEIKYYPEYAAFLFDSHSPDTTNNPDALMFWSDDFEIIGNVHEHPELMEK